MNPLMTPTKNSISYIIKKSPARLTFVVLTFFLNWVFPVFNYFFTLTNSTNNTVFPACCSKYIVALGYIQNLV